MWKQDQQEIYLKLPKQPQQSGQRAKIFVSDLSSTRKILDNYLPVKVWPKTSFSGGGNVLGVVVFSIVSLERSRAAPEAANREVERFLTAAGARLRFCNSILEIVMMIKKRRKVLM